jgi:hypothetical protein
MFIVLHSFYTVKTVDDIVMVFDAVRNALPLIALKQNTLSIDAFVTFELMLWMSVQEFLFQINNSAATFCNIFTDVQLSSGASRVRDADCG